MEAECAGLALRPVARHQGVHCVILFDSLHDAVGSRTGSWAYQVHADRIVVLAAWRRGGMAMSPADSVWGLKGRCVPASALVWGAASRVSVLVEWGMAGGHLQCSTPRLRMQQTCGNFSAAGHGGQSGLPLGSTFPPVLLCSRMQASLAAAQACCCLSRLGPASTRLCQATDPSACTHSLLGTSSGMHGGCAMQAADQAENCHGQPMCASLCALAALFWLPKQLWLPGCVQARQD